MRQFITAIGAGIYFLISLAACNSSNSALSVPSPTTTAPALRPSPTFLANATLTPQYLGVTPIAMRGAQWAMVARGLTIGLSFDPFPPHPASTTTYRVMLTDAQNQPVTDAVVQLAIEVGDDIMDGDENETLTIKLTHEGKGVYSARASLGSMPQIFVSGSLNIRRGSDTWALVISRSALGLY